MKFAMLSVAAACVLVVGCGGSSQTEEVTPDSAVTLEQAERIEQAERTRWRQTDGVAPVIAVTSTGSVDIAGTVGLSGTVTDNKAVYSVKWANNKGGSGRATLAGTATNATWSAAGIQLQTGSNTITLVAEDVAGNAMTITSTVTRSASGTTTTTTPTPAPAPSTTTTTWTRVASESGTFTLSSAASVRYGTGDLTVTRDLAAGTWTCSNATFGDPAPGMNKVCDVSSAAAVATTPVSAPAPAPAPSPTPAPAPAPAPATAGTTTTTTTTTTAATTFVNAAAVPAAVAGSASRLINTTTRQPYRDPDGMGAFRTVCQYSHMNFDDPLVYPGQVGKAHLHVFFGNTATNANTTPESLRTTGNGTCRGGIVNRTAYWVPALIDTRTGTPIIPAADSDIYYKTGYKLFGQDAQVVPFPVGFRMIAGDSKSQVAQPSSYFECDGTRVNGIPSTCGELRQVVEFPQCWDGVNLDSPDHRSHVVYASNGSCPSTHPVHFPEVTFRIRYTNIPSGAVLRLSSDITGAPAGSSGHGDWMNGWEQDVIESGINNIVKKGLSGGSDLVGDGRSIYY